MDKVQASTERYNAKIARYEQQRLDDHDRTRDEDESD